MYAASAYCAPDDGRVAADRHGKAKPLIRRAVGGGELGDLAPGVRAAPVPVEDARRAQAALAADGGIRRPDNRRVAADRYGPAEEVLRRAVRRGELGHLRLDPLPLRRVQAGGHLARPQRLNSGIVCGLGTSSQPRDRGSPHSQRHHQNRLNHTVTDFIVSSLLSLAPATAGKHEAARPAPFRSRTGGPRAGSSATFVVATFNMASLLC